MLRWLDACVKYGYAVEDLPLDPDISEAVESKGFEKVREKYPNLLDTLEPEQTRCAVNGYQMSLLMSGP